MEENEEKVPSHTVSYHLIFEEYGENTNSFVGLRNGQFKPVEG